MGILRLLSRVARALSPLAGLGALLALTAAAWAATALTGTQGFAAHPGWRLGVEALGGACALGVLGLPATLRRERARRARMAEVDAMSGAAFEDRLAVLFEAMGHAVERTGRRGDFGADLVVERSGARTVVQAKRYDNAVGIEAVQQATGAMRHYGADAAMVVTNSVCTPAARALAASNGVALVQRPELVRLLAAHPLDVRRGRVRRAAGVLVRQLGDGAVLVLYVVGLVLRGALALLGAPRRAARGRRVPW